MAVNITKIIIILLVIITFSVLIYFIVGAFRSKCTSGFVFDKEQNKCRIQCQIKQIYDTGKAIYTGAKIIAPIVSALI